MPAPAPAPAVSPRTSARRALLLLLTGTVALVGLLPATAHAASVGDLEGDGSPADPVLIADAADLDAVAAAVNSEPATYASLSYRLVADIDYDGATFAGFTTFSGTFDGDGHAIEDIVYSNARNSVGLFAALTRATVRDLTLTDVSGTTRDGTGSAGVVATTATDSVITGTSVVDARVTVAPGGAVNTQAAGLVAGSFGATRITDNVVWASTVTGHKYAAGLVAYPRAGTTLARNLVVDVDVVADAGGAGSTAGMLIAQHQATPGFDVSANVVVRGSATGLALTKGAGPAALTGTAPNLVDSSTRLGSGTVAGNTGTAATPEELATEATYVAAGWDLAGAWRWLAGVRHPAPAAAVPPTYTLDYDLAGGSLATANPASYRLGDAAVEVAAPVRDGYLFTGWTGTGLSSPTLGLQIPAGATGDRAYTATWTAAEYVVRYDLAGGSVAGGNPVSYTVESDAFTLTNPTRLGYTFLGWSGTGLSSPAMTVRVPTGSLGDRTYTATWSSATAYPVTYDLAGGTGAASNPSSITIESGAVTLADPTREGYRFAGWTGTGLAGPTISVTIPAGAVGARSYSATWVAIDYPITYDAQGGTLPDGNRGTYTVETGAFTLLDPVRTGYRFAGWTGTGLTAATTAVTVPAGATGVRSYRATWTPVRYPLTYDLAGGQVSNPGDYHVESGPITLANPTRTGHEFAGWVGTGLAGPSTLVTIATGSLGARSYVATWREVAAPRTATTVGLSVVDRATQRVRVRLSGAGAARATGTVTVTATAKVRTDRGTRVRTVTRTRTVRVDGASTTLRLRGLRPGRWRLTASYSGDADRLGATSRAVNLRVPKPAKGPKG
ncbi:InlB B-repeat-containing protein [Nocardioides sp. SYSU D00065]|uniref:InlB B-repeat-containing protein n=1 Tax=Nocardioides sp. SYSU D00065 TaxID=2817378 RepID=UPI001B340BE1|nr:InlB B-repeat-containing protein [Nocardioides sp. SYSU D00065]